ncbi:MAG: c-type cytochrome [Parafilimonas sp.]
MKKFAIKINIFSAFVIMLAACGAGTGKTAASDSANATESIINKGGASGDTAGNISGSRLIAANDCLTCHKINEQSVGPSYKQVADRYEMNNGNIENLADRIIKGAKGLWGQNAMTPHPNLSVPQAKAMSKYILSLRNSSDSTK